jgi:hypothetical protein
MPLQTLLDRALLSTYRLAGFAMVYLIDDAAIMAMMFC